jgi:hypothetical protein
MRVLLVAIALVLAAEASICKNDEAKYLDLAGMLSIVEEKITPVLSSCSGLAAALMNRDNGCVALMEQGYCYYMTAKARTPASGISYTQIEEGFPDITKLAGYGCKNTCFENIAPIVKGCYADESVKADILKEVASGFDKLRGFLVDNKGTVMGTPIGKVLSMGLDKYSDFDDVKDMVIRNKDAISAAYYEVKEKMQAFCAEGCPSKAKKWGVVLLPAIGMGECDNVKVFCGACADNTAAALPLSNPRMPCCMLRLYDYISEKAENAADIAASKGSAIGEELANIVYANAQYNCVKSVFDDYSDSRDCA